MQQKSIKSIGNAIDELIKNLGIQSKIKELDAVTKWENAVGKQIARMTTAVRITKGVLFVRVNTGTWRNELTLRKREIIEKLNDAIGTGIVKDIKFH